MTVVSSEQIAMTIIAGSGEARSIAFKALESARGGYFEEARELLKKAREFGVTAHRAQTELLTHEANGIKQDINILMIHAQDHLMTSLLAQELVTEIIHLYETKENRKDEK